MKLPTCRMAMLLAILLLIYLPLQAQDPDDEDDQPSKSASLFLTVDSKGEANIRFSAYDKDFTSAQQVSALAAAQWQCRVEPPLEPAEYLVQLPAQQRAKCLQALEEDRKKSFAARCTR